MKKWKYKPKGLFREVYAEMIFSAESLRINARAIFFALGVGMVVGVIGGAVGAIFHIGVEWATELRHENPYILWFLPVAGVAIVLLYRALRLEGKGTNQIIEAAQGDRTIPLALAPLIFVSTVLTHLCGGSAGKTPAGRSL